MCPGRTCVDPSSALPHQLSSGGQPSNAYRIGRRTLSRAPCHSAVQAGEGASQASGGKQKHQSCRFPSGEGESYQIQDFLGLLSKRAGWELERECPASLCHVYESALLGEHLPFAPSPWSFLLSLHTLAWEYSRKLSGCMEQVFTGLSPATWVCGLGRRGLKVTRRNHLLLAFHPFLAGTMECNETLF